MVRRQPVALHSLSKLWGDKKSIVKAAVEMNGSVIRYASTRLRADPELALIAACNDPTGTFFDHLMPSAKLIPAVVLSAVKDKGSLIRVVDAQFLEDQEVVFAACTTYPALPYASKTLRINQDFALRVARHCLSTHIGENLQDHVDNSEFLKQVVTVTCPDGIFLCRIYAMSGKAVLTSFTAPARETVDWRVDALGLIRLYGHVPDTILTTCRGISATGDDWARWAAIVSADAPFGLRLDELNDINMIAA